MFIQRFHSVSFWTEWLLGLRFKEYLLIKKIPKFDWANVLAHQTVKFYLETLVGS